MAVLHLFLVITPCELCVILAPPKWMIYVWQPQFLWVYSPRPTTWPAIWLGILQGLRLLPSCREDVEGLAEPATVASRGEDTHEGRASGHWKWGKRAVWGCLSGAVWIFLVFVCRNLPVFGCLHVWPRLWTQLEFRWSHELTCLQIGPIGTSSRGPSGALWFPAGRVRCAAGCNLDECDILHSGLAHTCLRCLLVWSAGQSGPSLLKAHDLSVYHTMPYQPRFEMYPGIRYPSMCYSARATNTVFFGSYSLPRLLLVIIFRAAPTEWQLKNSATR